MGAYMSRRNLSRLLAIFLVTLVGSRGTALSEDNTSIVINGFSTNIAAVTVGSSGTNNSLQILNAGFLTTSGNGVVGLGSTASNNFALITDPGSGWSIGGFLDLGDSGPFNQVTITNQATVTVAGSLYAGFGGHHN